MTLPNDWQPGEEHGYAEPPERTLIDAEMVTMVGPDGSVHEVDREVAAAATALLADIEIRITAAYEQGKEVGRVNGSARMDRAQREADELARENERLGDLLDVVRRQRDALVIAKLIDYSGDVPCGDGRCYCGGRVL